MTTMTEETPPGPPTLDPPAQSPAPEPPGDHAAATALPTPGQVLRRARWKSRHLTFLVWIVLIPAMAFYFWQTFRVGVDLRNASWAFWREHHTLTEFNNAQALANLAIKNAHNHATESYSDDKSFTRTLDHPGGGLLDRPWNLETLWQRARELRPLYSQLVAGTVDVYDAQALHPAAVTDTLDNPPLRLMLLTLWTWRSQTHAPPHPRFKPANEVIDRILELNTLCDAIAAAAAFFLVWMWVQRRPKIFAPNNFTRWLRWPWEARVVDPPSENQIMSSPERDALLRDALFRDALFKDLPAIAPAADKSPEPIAEHWSDRWGDLYLLAPLIVLAICMLISPMLTFTPEVSGGILHPPIDLRVASVGSWIFLLLRFATAIALARLLPRPFRAPACAAVAATLVWLNPASILADHAWPQTEVWMLPFFLVAALLVTVDWWLTAGIVLGVGCMFKSELLLVVPVLVLCPLLTGWPGKFLRIFGGFAAAMGICAWPWLISNPAAAHYVLSAVTGAAIVCVVTFLHPIIRRNLATRAMLDTLPPLTPSPSTLGEGRGEGLEKLAIPPIPEAPHPNPLPEYRERGQEEHRERGQDKAIGQEVETTQAAPIPSLKPRRNKKELFIKYLSLAATPVALLTAAILLLWIAGGHSRLAWLFSILFAGAVVGVPWLLPRKLFVPWLIAIFAASIWIAGWQLDGRFSWWNVGFAYATPTAQSIVPRGSGTSSVLAIMQSEFAWKTTDPLSTWHLPGKSDPLVLNVGQSLAMTYLVTAILCAIAAAIQLRRRDSRFLIALVAPWVLAGTLWVPLQAQFLLVPVAVAGILVGVSVGMSFLQFILAVISCTMIANLVLAPTQSLAPATWAIIHPANPDIAWTMPLLAATVLFCALAPRLRGSTEAQEI